MFQTKLERTCENIAFKMARALYQRIYNQTTDSLLMGYEVNVDGMGSYQIAFKVRKVNDGGVIEISDDEMNDLDYETIQIVR